MGVGEHHGYEEVAARAAGAADALCGIPRRGLRPPQVPEAVAKFRGELGVIEVLEPFRFALGVAGIEGADGFSERELATAGVAEPGKRPGLHGVVVSNERWCGDVPGSGPGCPREVGPVLEAAQEGGLMAHCVEDATGQPTIVSRFRETKGLDEV